MSTEQDNREAAFKAEFIALLKKYNADFDVSAGWHECGLVEIDFHTEYGPGAIVTRAGHSIELESIWTDSRDKTP